MAGIVPPRGPSHEIQFQVSVSMKGIATLQAGFYVS